jgi:hypothetical protein
MVAAGRGHFVGQQDCELSTVSCCSPAYAANPGEACKVGSVQMTCVSGAVDTAAMSWHQRPCQDKFPYYAHLVLAVDTQCDAVQGATIKRLQLTPLPCGLSTATTPTRSADTIQPTDSTETITRCMSVIP